MKVVERLVVIVPQNDPESLLIGELCQAFGILVLFSDQPHGAVLGAEPDVVARMKATYGQAKHIVIIEIPGIAEEKELEELGYEVSIIDHHRYDGLDRMKPKSSLEQFLDFFEMSDEDLARAGFSPLLVRGVGVIDRSFVWGLSAYSQEERNQVIDYYQSFLIRLEGEGRVRTEELARQALAGARESNGYLVVKNPKPGARIRDPLSFEIARRYSEPVPTILYDNEVIYVQESPKAKELYDTFGGFMYGGEERCWGKKTDDWQLKMRVFGVLGVDA